MLAHLTQEIFWKLWILQLQPFRRARRFVDKIFPTPSVESTPTSCFMQEENAMLRGSVISVTFRPIQQQKGETSIEFWGVARHDIR